MSLNAAATRSSRVAAHVEIADQAAGQLNQVHGRHGEARTVDHGGNIAVERDASRSRRRVGFRSSSCGSRSAIFAAEQRTAVDIGPAPRCRRLSRDQRIDLDQAGVELEIAIRATRRRTAHLFVSSSPNASCAPCSPVVRRRVPQRPRIFSGCFQGDLFTSSRSRLTR